VPQRVGGEAVQLDGADGGSIRIRAVCCGRSTYVAPLTREQHYWVIRPLIDAGMGVEQIRDLLFRLAFEGIVSEGRVTVGSLSEMVDDQPVVVQAAWSEVIGRMIAVHSTTA
jgi:hypothetical protein